MATRKKIKKMSRKQIIALAAKIRTECSKLSLEERLELQNSLLKRINSVGKK